MYVAQRTLFVVGRYKVLGTLRPAICAMHGKVCCVSSRHSSTNLLPPPHDQKLSNIYGSFLFIRTLDTELNRLNETGRY